MADSGRSAGELGATMTIRMVRSPLELPCCRSRLSRTWIAQLDAFDGRNVPPAPLVARHHQAGHALLVAHRLAVARVGQQNWRRSVVGIEFAPTESHLVAVRAGDHD